MIDTGQIPVLVISSHKELFSTAQIFQMDFDLHLFALQLKAGGIERWRAEKEMRVVGGADPLLRDTEAVLVQLAAAALVVDDRDRIDAIRNLLEDIEIRIPYFVQSAFSERMFHFTRKSMLFIEQRDAEIAGAIVGIEHFDHDTAGVAGWRFGWRGCVGG